MRNRTIAWVVLCLSSAACTIESHEDRDSDDEFCGSGGSNGTGAAGSGAGGGSGSGATGGGATGGGSGSGGSGTVDPPCSEEADCEPGFNCDLERGVCTPTDHETCGELTIEADCSARGDCEPIYAGVNCSCGADCECVGGEPGCVCERFEFFTCQPAPQ